MNIETRLVHPQHQSIQGDRFRASVPPVYKTATFDQDSPLAFGQYDYARSGNPTRDALETQVAALEGGTRAFAYASGVAALDAIATFLRPGDEIVVSRDVYGGTFRLFTQAWAKRGITARYEDLTDAAAVSGLLSARTKVIHAEALGNPMQTVCDVAALAEVARRHGALLSIDNTSLTPLNIRPLELGADIVLHSATKFLNGHGDVTAGVLTVRDDALAKELAFHHNAEGVALPARDCAALLRGLQTLALRLDRQQASALVVARFLAGHPHVKRVLFPGLDGHAGQGVHRAQSRGDGAVVSFETGSAEASSAIVQALTLFATRVSFGSVSSSASMPCWMSHKSIPASARAEHAPPADLVRLSIGIEHVQDLLDDLAVALARLDAPESVATDSPGRVHRSHKHAVRSRP